MVKRIAIAGGIGAGKSALTSRLREFGYSVVDADDVAHDVTSRGSPAWQALRDAFGDAVLTDTGALDRAFVAQIVFNDSSSLRRLNQITHGAIGHSIQRALDEATGDFIFVAIPLFRPEHRDLFALDEAWAILVDPETAVRRLIEQRGFSEEDARARVANQMSNDERTNIVDRVIWNDGTVEDLFGHLDEVLTALGAVHG
jgi:dephospho-CoA kinase